MTHGLILAQPARVPLTRNSASACEAKTTICPLGPFRWFSPLRVNGQNGLNGPTSASVNAPARISAISRVSAVFMLLSSFEDVFHDGVAGPIAHEPIGVRHSDLSCGVRFATRSRPFSIRMGSL